MGGTSIHEQFLKFVWIRRAFHETDLRTTDGRSVEIVSPGRLNDGAGPDVRDAKVRIGTTLLTGDIEFHKTPAEWHRHGHHRNPAYNKVILHVVLNAASEFRPAVSRSGRVIPLLPLAPFFSEPLEQLWDTYIANNRTTTSLACFGQTRRFSEKKLQQWLRRMDIERLESRMFLFQERLRELVIERNRGIAEPWRRYGTMRWQGLPEEIPLPNTNVSRYDLVHRPLWDQVLYEGIMEGLGYSRNRQPFVHLARIATLDLIRSLHAEDDLTVLGALLFGVSGLLPLPRTTKETSSREYVQLLFFHWRQLRKHLRTDRVHRAEWQFFPTRPHNFPTVRIAAACSMIRAILRNDLFRSVVRIIKTSRPRRMRIRSLQKLFMPETDEYWSHHYHFDRPRERQAGLLGVSRINDILANTVFPLCLLYARVFTDSAVRRGVFACRDAFPLLTENNTTRIMNRELFYGKNMLTTLSLQQGAIQLHRYYCTQGRCMECDVGRRVFAMSSAVSSLPRETGRY